MSRKNERSAYTPRLVLEFEDPRAESERVKYRLVALAPHQYVIERAEADALGGRRWQRVGGVVDPSLITGDHENSRLSLLAMALDSISSQVAIHIAEFVDRASVAEDRANHTDAAMALRALSVALRTGHWKDAP